MRLVGGLVILVGILVSAGMRAAGATPPSVPANRYLDPDLPGRSARPFAPGMVSLARGEGIYSERPVFSPDFRECYFDVTDYRKKTFTSMSMRYEGGKWTRPEPAFFARYGGVQASFAADGRKLLFTAPSRHDFGVRGIWMAERTSTGWSDPHWLGPPVNTGSDTSFPCLTRSGSLYFLCTTRVSGANHSGADGGGVCRARPDGLGEYGAVETLSPFQKTAAVVMGDFYVAPDEAYLVIYATLPDNLGSGDLYVSFRRPDDTWGPLRNLGPAVNTKGYDFAPSVSPDGRFLFFTRDADKQGNVFWISSEILDR